MLGVLPKHQEASAPVAQGPGGGGRLGGGWRVDHAGPW